MIRYLMVTKVVISVGISIHYTAAMFRIVCPAACMVMPYNLAVIKISMVAIVARWNSHNMMVMPVKGIEEKPEGH